MSEITSRMVKTNGIDMHVTEAGPSDGKPVIFVHGFPELSRSWRHQVSALGDAGYRAVAPDMRGYGRTTQPKEVEAYNVIELAKDLMGLLDDLGAEKAAFVGHDWGAWMMWFTALLHPERVECLVNLSVPYMPRAASKPIPTFKQIFGDIFFYMLYFQDVGPAEEELERDVRRTVKTFAWSVSGEAAEARGAEAMTFHKVGEGGFLDMLSELPEGKTMEWFTDEDLEYFVGEFERTGYFGGLSWYRNIDRNWEMTPQLDDAKPSMPVLFIAGSNDPVIRMMPPDGMKETVPDLKGIELIDGAGHWVHMENPEPVNELILKFLKDVGY